MSVQGQDAIHQRFLSFGAQGQSLYADFVRAIHEALTSAAVNVFWIGTGLAVLGLLAALFLKDVPLRRADFYEAARQAPPADPAGDVPRTP